VSNLRIGSKGPYLLIRPLDHALTFTDVVFLMVAMAWLLDDEDIWCVELEYRLKRAIPFHPIIGSRSNFYISCFPSSSYGMATR
jgi:hypothetical protein